MKKSDFFFNVVRLPVDLLMLISAGLSAYFLRTEILSFVRPVLFEINLPLIKYFYLVGVVSLIFLGTFALAGLYSMKSRLSIGEEFTKVVIGSSAGILIVIIYIFLRQELFDSRFLVLGSWLLAIFFVSTGRFIVRHLQAIMVSKYNFGIHKLLVIGDNEASDSIISAINSDASFGYRIVGNLTEPSLEDIKDSFKNKGLDEIILTRIDYSHNQIRDLLGFCQDNHIVFKFTPGLDLLFSSNIDIDIFKDLPIVEIKRTSLDGWGRVAKRVIDIIGSILGLILLSPLFAVVAFIIKWETEGPVLVKLKRVSKNSEFYLYKFRSMIDNAHELNQYLRLVSNDRTDAGPLWKMKNDPRVTRFGRILRKFRIDEFPQLINVINGDMSLVGPRPHQPDEISHYQNHHKKVLAIKAGITGLAQVSGSSDISFEQEVTLDSFYIDNWSLWLDLKIFLKTIFKMFFDKSAV